MDLFKEAIEVIERENVAQFVIDSASNNVLCQGLIKDKYPTIFWTPFFMHYINLILKYINNIASIGNTITKARMLHIFISNHATSIEIYRKYANLQFL